jgi:hypothetical protein
MPNGPPLDYEQRASFVSQRQYRRLMALTLLNTLLLAGFVCGPSVSNLARTQWNQFQQRREQRRVEQARDAAIAAGKQFARAADTILYEERPDEAAKLLATRKYKTISDASIHYFPQRPWQPPVIIDDPLPQFRPLRLGNSDGVIFMHALKNPFGQERLAIVLLHVKQQIYDNPGVDQDRRYYYLRAERALVAGVTRDDGALGRRTLLNLDVVTDRAYVLATPGPQGNDKIEHHLKGMFRIYAGQPDPADPAHFTIALDYDDQHTTIDGWLRADDHIELLPRTGRITDRDIPGERLVWDPTLPPATQSP